MHGGKWKRDKEKQTNIVHFLIQSLFFCITILVFFPRSVNATHAFAQGSLLYLQAQEGGLSYAIDNRRKAKNLPFEWDFGFKIALGYQIPHDHWNVLLQFSNLQTHTDTHIKSTDYALFPTWQIPFSPFSPLQMAKAHWRLHFALMDGILEKSFRATPSLTLTPQLGIQWGSARQKYNLFYVFPQEATSLRMKNKFWGIGPCMGMHAKYTFAPPFSLFAKANVSFLYGNFYIHQSAHNTQTKLLDIHSLYRALSTIWESSLGVAWEHRRTQVEIGWDQFLLFAQNQFMHFQTAGQFLTNQGDLAIEGVHVAAMWHF